MYGRRAEPEELAKLKAKLTAMADYLSRLEARMVTAGLNQDQLYPLVVDLNDAMSKVMNHIDTRIMFEKVRGLASQDSLERTTCIGTGHVRRARRRRHEDRPGDRRQRRQGPRPGERRDLSASFFHSLGIDHHKEYHTNTGRPIMINRDGKIIPQLFA